MLSTVLLELDDIIIAIYTIREPILDIYYTNYAKCSGIHDNIA